MATQKLRISFIASLVLVCCSAFAQFNGTWAFTYGGGSVTPAADGGITPTQSGGTYTVVASAGSPFSPKTTVTAKGPTSFTCTYTPAANDPIVLAAGVEIVVTATSVGVPTGSASDGFGDGANTKNDPGGYQTVTSTGTHWMSQFYTCSAANGYSFTVSISQGTATALPGNGSPVCPPGTVDEAKVSCEIVPCLVGLSLGGATLVSSKPSILVGQPFAPSVVSQVPTGSGDSYNWTSPAPNDSAYPFAKYSCGSSSAFTPLTALSGSSLSCFFGIGSPGGAQENVACIYHSGVVGASVTLTAPSGVQVYAPSIANAPNYIVTPPPYQMSLLDANYNSNDTNPVYFWLFGAVWQGTKPTDNGTCGMLYEAQVTDPAGFGGTPGQWNYISNIPGQFVNNVDTPVSYVQDPIKGKNWVLGLDTSLPYSATYPYPGPQPYWYAANGADVLFIDAPGLKNLQAYPSAGQGTFDVHFQTYILYTPPGTGCDPVPFPAADWTVNGTCTQGSPWTGPPGSCTSNGAPPATPFPYWPQIAIAP